MNIEVMAVDKKEENVQAVMDSATNAMIGDCTKEAFIRTLGVNDFDVCYVAIGEDFLASLEATFFLKEYGAKKIVARAARDTQEKILMKNGADAVVYPERHMGEWTAVQYSSDNIFDYIPLSKNLAVFEVKVPDSWVGKSIVTIDVRKKYHLNIIGIKQGDEMLPAPSPDYLFNLNERLLVLGTAKQIRDTFDTE